MVTSLLFLVGLSAPRASFEVVTTQHFNFYSDPRLNLHDQLNQLTRGDSELEPEAAACLEALSQRDRDGWSQAIALYRERLSELFIRGDEMSAVRARILDGSSLAGGELVDAVFDHLEQARPAYDACLWEEQDRRNRAWIASVAPRVRAHEAELTARLSALFLHEWPEARLPVDLVAWVSPSGANTIDLPAHVMISSVDPGYRDDAGLEMIFHESSHLLIGPRYGRVAEEIARANGDRMLPRRDLWHTILFYTAGQATKERLAETGTPGYVPYLYAQGLIERGWRVYREPLETHWQSYMDGTIDLATAADRLVGAIHAAQPR
ncbi:MAG TPA: hypothetical protein VEK15_07865 [Vicinamibacteria bacterium]|nr:hypothetical protein [Vicinamibacteria bacterium]